MFAWLRSKSRNRQKSSPSHRRFRPLLLPLEGRLAPAVFSVTNTNDTGAGSFYQALLDANASADPVDTIDFNIGGGGVQTLSPAFQLPDITGPVVIDGTTQPGYAGKPLIELSGADAPFGSNGLVITGGRSTVRGLAINRYSGPAGGIHESVTGTAIVLRNGSRNVIEGNFIGTDVTGTIARPNTGDGIAVVFSARNTIGGTADGAGNVLAGNGRTGVYIQHGNNTIVAGNKIGTNVAGTAKLGNGLHGVLVRADFTGPGSSTNTVGGTAPGARNIISGNGGAGVGFHQGAGTGNVVLGNYIGTDITGTSKIGNVEDGVTLSGAGGLSTVGGTAAGAGNVISGNTRYGVAISGAQFNQVLGNLIGTDAGGTMALGNSQAGVAFALQAFANNNTVSGNVISANLGDGVLFHSGSFNSIQDNYIGTDITGTKALGNAGWGVHIAFGPPHGANFNTRSNVIGTNGDGVDDAAEGNVITANASGGVLIRQGTTKNVVAGNRIGTDPSGTITRGNGNGPGVSITEDAPINRIGTNGDGVSDDVEGNVITGHKAGGVIVQGAGSTRNSIRGNSIFANTSLGIDLGNNGVTPNHVGGATGPNEFQNYPVLTSATSGAATQVAGTFNSLANATFTLEFFANAAADPSGFGEGQRLLGSTTVTTDANGDASFNVTLAGASGANEFITATATSSTGNTSEFSAVLFVNQPPSFTSTPPTDGAEDSPYSYAITTADADAGDTRTITASTTPSWLTLVDNGDGTATLSGTPSAGDVGTHSVVLQVTDAAGASDTQSFTITVEHVSHAPSFTSAPPTEATEDALYSYAITTNDPDAGDTRTITAPTLPSWLILVDNGDGTATLFGTPSRADVGTHSVVLEVTDAAGASATQSFTITCAAAPTYLHHGQTATIGFWQNNNGQALIKSLNGGSQSTALGNWLATSFANLYGAGAGVNNLTGKTNSEVAAYYLTLFKVKGQKLEAQVMGTALAVYVTNSNLAGTTAVAYGFEVTAQGTGAALFNVGASGAAFGVANNTVMSVLDILHATNTRSSGGMLYNGSSTLKNLANTVYDGINRTGDIG